MTSKMMVTAALAATAPISIATPVSPPLLPLVTVPSDATTLPTTRAVSTAGVSAKVTPVATLSPLLVIVTW